MRSAKEILSGIPTPFRAGGGGASSPAESRRNRERKHHSTGKEHLTRPFALSGDVLSSIFSAGDELAKYTSKSAEEVEVSLVKSQVGGETEGRRTEDLFCPGAHLYRVKTSQRSASRRHCILVMISATSLRRSMSKRMRLLSIRFR